MKEYSVALSLADYIPVLLFFVTGVLLMRDLCNKMSKGGFALFRALVPRAALRYGGMSSAPSIIP